MESWLTEVAAKVREAHAEKEYRPVAVGIIENARGELLLVQSVKNENEWYLPQGGIDADEDPVKGLLRELSEELGLEEYDLKLLEYRGMRDLDAEPGRTDRRGFSKGKRYFFFKLARTNDKPLTLLSAELKDYTWASTQNIAETLATSRPEKRALILEVTDAALPLAQNIFEKKAQTILSYLKSDLRYGGQFLPRPFIGEITGTPAAGKSTTIDELDKFFKRHNFRVRRIHEGAEVVRHIERTTPLYNLRTGLYALELLIDITASHMYDIVLFDRGIFDAYCWMMYWLEKGQLSIEERDTLQKFFLSRFWVNTVDVAYFFICEADEALRREHRVTLSKKTGNTTNPKTINSLISRYKDAYRILSPSHPQLFLVDTTHVKEQEMIEKIASQMLDIFAQKAKATSK